MKLDIKLSDGTLNYIFSETSCENEKDYYGYTSIVIYSVRFIFEGTNGKTYQYNIECKDVELTDFLAFFYGADFSSLTIKDFCNDVQAYLSGGSSQYFTAVTSSSFKEITDKKG